MVYDIKIMWTNKHRNASSVGVNRAKFFIGFVTKAELNSKESFSIAQKCVMYLLENCNRSLKQKRMKEKPIKTQTRGLEYDLHML